jgi:hypothetical protein
MRCVIIALAVLLAANAAQAAKIVVERPETPTSPAVITIAGRFDRIGTDFDAFFAITERMEKATEQADRHGRSRVDRRLPSSKNGEPASAFADQRFRDRRSHLSLLGSSCCSVPLLAGGMLGNAGDQRSQVAVCPLAEINGAVDGLADAAG